MQNESLGNNIINLAESCRSLLNSEAMLGVDHYLEHGEPEMALEGLLIELIKANCYPIPFGDNQLEDIVQASGLSDGGVFDDQIWDKFCQWRDNRLND